MREKRRPGVAGATEGRFGGGLQIGCKAAGPPRQWLPVGKLHRNVERQFLTGQRPSRLNAGGLIVQGRSTTRNGRAASNYQADDLVCSGVTHHAAGGGCLSTCGNSASMRAQRGADDVQIVIAGLARFGWSKVPTRTKIR